MKKLLILIFTLVPFSLRGQESANTSVLSNGNWYQFKVLESGVYKIDYNQMYEIGIDLNDVDPRLISVYGNSGAMLPQPNDAEREADLIENTIFVRGEDDGRFDEGDYLLFYADGAGAVRFDLERKSIEAEPHLYDRSNYYYLTVGQKPGLRIEPDTDIPPDANMVITYFDDYVFHKRSLKNLLASGRKWYGEEMAEGEVAVFDLSVRNVFREGEARLKAAVMSTSKKNARFDFSLDGTKIGEIETEKVDFYAYGNQAKENEEVIEFDANLFQATGSSNLEISFDDLSGDAGYLDYFLLNYQRKLSIDDTQLRFRSFASLNFEASNFEVSGMNANMKVWNISKPNSILEMPVVINGDVGNIVTFTDSLKEMVIFDPLVLSAPDFVEKVPNQNLRGLETPDLLVITTTKFLGQAERLAGFRASNDDLVTAVVDLNMIYHEFSSGKRDVTALRDFIRHLYTKSGRLKYLLLFGDASYDYLSDNEENTNIVPTYQSRNSLHNVFTYASDDYFTFMDDVEGNWRETNSYFQLQHDLDIGVGRLPVKTEQEAKIIVDKLIAYSENEGSDGAWRNKVIFVADDGEANKFQYQSDYLASLLEKNDPDYQVDRLFLDAYPIENVNGRRSAPKVRERINQHVNDGILLLDFIGHGGEAELTNEDILDLESIDSWENGNKLPVILTATCEFGRHDDWESESGAEKMLFKENGGAIALFTNSRPAIVNTNFDVSKAFYDNAFNYGENEKPRLGDILRKTKNQSVFGIVNRNFVLLGDPSMQLAYPQYDVVITEINNNPVTDTLQSFSNVKMIGEVRDGLSMVPDFDGILNITLYDQKAKLTTMGNGNNEPMTYENWDNLLVRGAVSIKSGRFEMNFTVPGGLKEGIKEGKMILYAYENSSGRDASGSYDNLKIQNNGDANNIDKQGPDISLSLDFDEFENGGLVGENVLLKVKLQDESGINLSADPENGIVAYLDNKSEEKIMLNRFYQSELDDFTSGRLSYQISDLAPGIHSLTVEASDNFNNRSSATIDFTVIDEDFILLQNVIVYPNPAADLVNFEFNYKNAPDDLPAILLIYSSRGELVKVVEENFTDHSSGKHIIQWDRTNTRGQIASPGLYFYDFYLRSLLNNQANKKGKILLY